ncbi:MAG: hypothetical protein M3406_12070 [Chloroflexota bacterium]|nr:hypothetical protein [Chloroflexota bacterium]
MRELDGMRIIGLEEAELDQSVATHVRPAEPESFLIVDSIDGKPLGGEGSGRMRLLGTAMLVAIATGGSAASPVRAAAPVPSGGGAVAANVPWLLLVGLVLAAAAILALWQPALRRLMAGAAVLVVGAVVAWSVLLMGAVSTMDTDGDVPSWAIAGAALILLIGVAAAAKIALSGRSSAG